MLNWACWRLFFPGDSLKGRGLERAEWGFLDQAGVSWGFQPNTCSFLTVFFDVRVNQYHNGIYGQFMGTLPADFWFSLAVSSEAEAHLTTVV